MDFQFLLCGSRQKSRVLAHHGSLMMAIASSSMVNPSGPDMLLVVPDNCDSAPPCTAAGSSNPSLCHLLSNEHGYPASTCCSSCYGTPGHVVKNRGYGRLWQQHCSTQRNT
jgi:hypothetical protein